MIDKFLEEFAGVQNDAISQVSQPFCGFLKRQCLYDVSRKKYATTDNDNCTEVQRLTSISLQSYM